jgi:hypothetical protein
MQYNYQEFIFCCFPLILRLANRFDQISKARGVVVQNGAGHFDFLLGCSSFWLEMGQDHVLFLYNSASEIARNGTGKMEIIGGKGGLWDGTSPKDCHCKGRKETFLIARDISPL